MKTEHFRALHIHKFPQRYQAGINAVKMTSVKDRPSHWETVEECRTAIEHRRFAVAAYWLGYGDMLAKINGKVTKTVRRDAPHRVHNHRVTSRARPL